MKLVKDWKNWPKWFSTWFEAASAAFFSAMLLAPDTVLQIWTVLPADIREAIPADWLKWGGVLLIVAGSISKVIDQPKLEKKREMDN